MLKAIGMVKEAGLSGLANVASASAKANRSARLGMAGKKMSGSVPTMSQMGVRPKPVRGMNALNQVSKKPMLTFKGVADATKVVGGGAAAAGGIAAIN